MTTLSAAAVIFVVILIFSVVCNVHGLGGSATTVSVSYGTTVTVCGIVAGQPSQRIQCWRDGQVFDVFSNISFESIAGGRDVFCGVRSGGSSLVCWNPSLTPKRLYYNETVLLRQLTIGDGQICGITNSSGLNVECWRSRDELSIQNRQFQSISSGLGFTCGVVANNADEILCFGTNSELARDIQGNFTDFRMLNVAVGGNHACGVNSTGFLICRGHNDYGQINVPKHSPFEFSALALGSNHTCALRKMNSHVVCWGGGGGILSDYAVGVSFESIVAGLDFTCGLTTNNLSVICWGEGWVRNSSYPLGFELPLRTILPGPCVLSDCDCGIYTQSAILCSGSGSICKPCDISSLSIPSPPPSGGANVPQSSSPSRPLRRGLLAFAIVGSIGAFAGICTILYCLWTGVCCGNKKIHNSVQPTITGSTHNAPQLSNSSPISRSSTIRRQASRAFRRQRSGTSSKHADREEEFTFADLALATDNFSQNNKIGAGSFGIVYKGKLLDGREVAIKRGETSHKTKKFQEKESAFDSELAFLSRLHHKHLVRLVGYCEEREEKLLVYEYMKNGALYDHLHDKKNTEKSSSLLNSWKMRIKISLDAARGIEYLHNYAVPPIIHRDIKSSNILLDANWVARVSDFGLSLMGPESDSEHRPTKAAGTVGYIDPEYYGLNVVTAKSDVYGLGVVLLELLTGKRAIFKSDNDNGGAPISLVDFSVPAIITGDLAKILDKRVGPPEVNEAEAVELMAYTAIHCVNLEGRERPTMSDIVANLERAVTLCDDSHGSISSGQISIVSE
ncbi:putative serine/threonine-protein kinase-like protein CCR3 [Cynara cardunculus var. scolymus]|uniref:putative serine/threonine-protein kinase-like protein CCR3 n=1 Tax=Cynara cardunculus var. scolymus TaxID=59895 RepID=UPI000D62CFA1|nr:putative serine/threonine-protein kinase-like protein CCR3 [Cynara cardunculus var. scolymus]